MFKVGQKIVCIDDSDLPPGFPVITKGSTYTSMGVSENGKDVHLEEFPGRTQPYFGYLITRFRGVQYTDITASLASQVTVGDTCDQPVRVLETN